MHLALATEENFLLGLPAQWHFVGFLGYQGQVKPIGPEPWR